MNLELDIDLKKIKEYYNTELIEELKNCISVKNFLNIITKLPDKVIQNLIYIFNYNYYYDNEFLISDQFFDILENFAKEKKIKLEEICYKENSLNEIDLPEEMNSIKKFYPEDTEKINKNLKKYFNDNILVGSKLDGVSCLLIKNKKKIFLYTKGNTEKGRDISHVLKNMNFDASSLINKEKYILRGELIIKKENRKFLNSEKTLRSQVIGLINLKSDSKNLQKYIDIVFYQIFTPIIEHYKQYNFFKQNNLNHPFYKILKLDEIDDIGDTLSNLYEEYDKEEKYEIDGLVISNPDIKLDLKKKFSSDYFFAFKKNMYFSNTKIIDIKWNISTNLKCIPILIIEPTKLNNSIIKKINGFNAKYIINNKIGINSIIRIKLSGNVIPNIDVVIKESLNIPLPENSYWDETNTNLYSNIIDNSSIAKNILKFYNNFKIKHFAFLTIKKIIDFFTPNKKINNIFNYIDVINEYFENDKLNDKKILGTKSDELLKESINIFKTKEISIINILISTNKFKLFEEIKFLNIFKNYPEIIDIIKNNNSTIEDLDIDKLNKLDNINEKTINNFISGLNYFLKKRNKYNTYFNINYDVVIKQTSLNIVFTNVKEKDKKCLTYLKNFYTEYISVNKNISYVVTVDEDYEITEKIKKAKKYNIPIITIKEFYDILKKNKN